MNYYSLQLNIERYGSLTQIDNKKHLNSKASLSELIFVGKYYASMLPIAPRPRLKKVSVIPLSKNTYFLNDFII